MALRYAPRVKETTTISGTGTYSLSGASTGFQGFVSGIGDTNTVCYCCTDGTDWEIGVGTVTDASTDTLSRTTILSSSNSGNAVDWTSATKDVFCIFPYNMLNYLSGNLTGAFEGTEYDLTLSVGNNTITNLYSNGLIVGNSNTVSASLGAYIFGNTNTVSNSSTVVGKNNDNEASECFLIGDSNVIRSTAPYSYAFGYGSANRYSPGSLLFSTNIAYGQGTFQSQHYQVAVSTTDATTTGIGYEWGSSYEFKQGTLKAAANDTASLLYDILVLARQVDGSSGTIGDSKAWRLQAMALESSGTLTQVGSTTTTNIAASTGASSWTATLDFSQTYPIRVTGQSDKDILWIANITIVEASNGYSV